MTWQRICFVYWFSDIRTLIRDTDIWVTSLGDFINKWRKSLDLEEIVMIDGPNLARYL